MSYVVRKLKKYLGGGVAPAIDTDATAWKNAVVGAGGTVSNTRLALVSSLITNLKSNSLWTLLDRLWLFAAENTQSALTDIKSLQIATAVNSPTFTIDRGYAGNGTTSYVDTNYNPSTNAVAYALNSAHLCNYVQSMVTQACMGTSGGGVVSLIANPLTGTGGQIVARINRANAGGGQGASNAEGFYIADRIDASNVVNFKNGSDVGTDANASSAIPSNNITVGAIFGLGGVINASRYSMASIGGSLGASGRASFATAINTYMTAIGANTY